jgi:predicted amidophosphoribosyltransferase
MAVPFSQDLLSLLPLEWLIRPGGEGESPSSGALLQPPIPPPIQGERPLHWWAAGLYEAGLRRQLLGLRRDLQPQRLLPLVRGLAAGLKADPQLAALRTPPLLVPVPSWKSRANPLPPLLARQLSAQLRWPLAALLARSRPVLGQHRLNRDLRWANQQGAFRCLVSARADPRGRRPVLLLDDILTTGATACSAVASLEAAGWRPLGMACLARTPEHRRP